MKIKTATLALTLAALAAPAIAAPAASSDSMTQHMEALQTPLAEACMGSDTDPAQQVEKCQAALAELDATRKRSPKASLGEKANFDFLQAVLLSGLAAAYAQIDSDVTPRVCTTFEQFWIYRHRLLSVPETAVPAEAYQAFQQIPPETGTVLDICRGKFGTPKEGAPRPAQ